MERETRRRSGLEVSVDVLRAIGEGAEGIVYIMAKAGLSYPSVKPVLVQLIRQALVVEPSKERYLITARGRDVLSELMYLRTYFPYISEVSPSEGAPFILPA